MIGKLILFIIFARSISSKLVDTAGQEQEGAQEFSEAR